MIRTRAIAFFSVLLRLAVLARPRGAVLIVCLPLMGFGYAHWEGGSLVAFETVLPPMALLVAVWALAHAGSLWLNAALDHDSGPVLLGRPVEVPAIAPHAGYAALVGCVAIAWPLGAVPFACATACALLAVAYSHPRVALKGSAVGGPLVNGIGYGALSPIAGWAAGDPVFTWRALFTLALSIAFLLGTYFAAQAFQGEEDGRRGYRTLVVTHGPGWTLAIAHACLRVAVLGLLAAAVAGAYPRALLLAAPVWLSAEEHMSTWRRAPSAARAGGLVARIALGTFVTVMAAYAHHFWLFAQGRPAGGCGTAVIPAALAHLCG